MCTGPMPQPKDLGSRPDQMTAWLDANSGADAWAITPSGIRGVVNDALAIYFLDATMGTTFVVPLVCDT
jgi:hypothetical protein